MQLIKQLGKNQETSASRLFEHVNTAVKVSAMVTATVTAHIKSYIIINVG